MFYSHFCTWENVRVLWCLPACVCIRVVFVPQVGREGADCILLGAPTWWH